MNNRDGIAVPLTLNRPLAFATASLSGLFLALVGVLGQVATRELSVFPALFLRYLVATLVILLVLRGGALRTPRDIGRLDWLRVGSVLISQFCLFYYLNRGSLSIGMLLYNTGPLFSPILARLLFGITFGTRTVVSLLLGFAGVALILNPFGERLDGTVLIALASGFFNACSQLAFHQISHHEDNPFKSLFPFYVLLTLCSIAPLPFVWEQTMTAWESLGQWHTLAVVVGLGIFGVIQSIHQVGGISQRAQSGEPGAVSLPLTGLSGALRLGALWTGAKYRNFIGWPSHPRLCSDHSFWNADAP